MGSCPLQAPRQNSFWFIEKNIYNNNNEAEAVEQKCSMSHTNAERTDVERR